MQDGKPIKVALGVEPEKYTTAGKAYTRRLGSVPLPTQSSVASSILNGSAKVALCSVKASTWALDFQRLW